MIKPTVHLNGTSRGELQRQYEVAASALGHAIDAVVEAGPHGRDYYVQGPDASSLAIREHEARVMKLREVLAEIDDIHRSLYI